MNTIQFSAYMGDKIFMGRLSMPYNGHPETWHVYVNNFYSGSLLKRDGSWCCNHNPGNLQSEDISVMGEMIDKWCGENGIGNDQVVRWF